MITVDTPAQPGVSFETLPEICIKSWEGHGYRTQRKIVCAANRFNLVVGESIIIPGARHYSPTMRTLAKTLEEAGIISSMMVCGDDQGFIDQFDDYWTREEAMIIAQHAGQVNAERNGHLRELFSEGLY